MRIDQIELTGSLSISSSLATSPLRVNKTYLFVSNTGNIGIGTNNPTSKLVVTGSVAVRGGLRATTMSGSFTGSVKLSTIPLGTSETNIVLVNGGGDLVYRNNLSLTGAQGAQGPTGANAGITSFTNAADNRILTSVSSTTINAESNLTFDGSILDVNTTAALKVPVGTTAERPISPTNGMIRFNTTIQSPEFHYLGYWIPTNKYSIDYVVVGGGGGGGKTDSGQGSGGGGGAGGYRSSYNRSGGNFSKETPLELVIGVNYNVTIGAGGVGATSVRTRGTSGGNSAFSVVTSIGGGGGGGGAAAAVIGGLPGGSGGGASYNGGSGGLGVVNQGYTGGGSAFPYGGGGGGASSVGISTSINNSGGGDGIFLDISGVSLEYSRGGNTNSTSVVNGESNRGSGGSSSYAGAYNGGNGGSGVVIIKYPSIYTVSNPDSGLTFSTVISGSDKITTFTAGTGNIQFN